MDTDRLNAALDAAETDARDRLHAAGVDVASIVDARRDSATDDEHDPEGATLAFERSQADAIAAGARTRLGEIAAARSRLGAGTYGRCEVCGEPIADGRLLARPWAIRCVAHA